MDIISILPASIGLAISPVPIIAVILMLFSAKAKSNGITFAVTWVLTIGIVAGLIIYLVTAQGFVAAEGSEPTDQWLKLILGILLFLMAIKSWKSRPKKGEAPKMPKWMAGIDAFTSAKSAGFAMLLSAANPKNLTLIIAGAVAIAETGEINQTTWIMLGIFMLLASSTVVIPVVYYIIAGKKAEVMLNKWKQWLIANNDTVMFWLLLIVSIILLSQSIPSFF